MSLYVFISESRTASAQKKREIIFSYPNFPETQAKTDGGKKWSKESTSATVSHGVEWNVCSIHRIEKERQTERGPFAFK